jgi:hypothetical protein
MQPCVTRVARVIICARRARILYAPTDRIDWSDGGHEFVHREASEADARAFVPGERGYWSRGPIQPTRCVVGFSARDFELRRRRRPCRALDCPEVTQPVGVVGASVVDGGGQ